MPIPREEYRFLGKTGLRVSSISLGGWITYGSGQQVEDDKALEIMDTAFKNGINFFDTAEGYGAGECEVTFGNVIKKLGWKRSHYVLSTKIYFGTDKDVNGKGLSAKHLAEGIDASLKRLQHDYVDIVFAHRPDKYTPMEEVVRAFTQIIRQGKAFYWGTSMWNAYEIERANHIATKYNLIPPVAEQPVYNLLERDWFEREYEPLFRDYGYGTTVFSPLATGLLTGKYTDPDNTPEGSRYSAENRKNHADIEAMYQAKVAKVKHLLPTISELGSLAKELDVPLAALSLAWLLKNPNVSTVITGASRPEQIVQNIEAYKVLPKLTDEVLERIEKIVNNKPALRDDFGRLGN
uniref:ARAD1D13948p n=1 Tax=Blastobotrys adeninivorans TaxID=409370 RepID=A0A060TEA7_BLAAD